ncbi:MAG: hypothetical protein K6G50_01255 [bacterium]|nr:hypothetical protein [bacterium]
MSDKNAEEKDNISEEKALNQLKISEFGQMTKEKLVKFSSILPRMDPEVAKKALEQFPSFTELSSALVEHYKTVVDKAFEKNGDSQKAFYESCNSILDSLRKELEKENLTPEEKERIEDKMIEVAKLIGQKDNENKSFLIKSLEIMGCIIVLPLFIIYKIAKE